MKSIVRYTLISFICIAVIFTAAAVALGLYFDPSVAHMTIEDNSRTAQGRFDGLTLTLISAEKTEDNVRIQFSVQLPEEINAADVVLKSVVPHFPFAKPDGGYNYAIYATDTEANTITYELVINAEDFPVTARPMTVEITDLISVTDLGDTVLDFTGELRFIVK